MSAATRTIAIVFPQWQRDIFPDDVDSSHRVFGSVVRVISRTAPLVHVDEPGTALVAARGPSRYFGGDESVARRLFDDCINTGVPSQCGVAVADGRLAACIAAHRSATSGVPVVVPEQQSSRFLSRLSVEVLHRHGFISHDTADLLRRLGLRTIAAVARIDERSLVDRFGAEGVVIHQLVHGNDAVSLVPDEVPIDFSVREQWDVPLHTEAVVIATVHDACVHFIEHLASRGLQCTRVRLSMWSDHDEMSDRVWHEQRGFTSGAIIDRVRWQLSGWTDGGARDAPTAGVVRIDIVPIDVRHLMAEQQQLWGGRNDHDERAARSVMLARAVHSHVSITVPRWQGGRDVLSMYGNVDASIVDLRDADACSERVARGGGVPLSWSGALMQPLPITLHHNPIDVDVLDDRGRHVVVTGRHELSARPATLQVPEGNRVIRAWAGPWPLEERWWDPSRRRRFARLQVCVDDEVLLLHIERSRWTLVARYD